MLFCHHGRTLRVQLINHASIDQPYRVCAASVVAYASGAGLAVTAMVFESLGNVRSPSGWAWLCRYDDRPKNFTQNT